MRVVNEPLPTAEANASSSDARRQAARDDYRASLANGTRLTGADLAGRHGMSERWGRDRIAEVRASSNGTGDRPATAAVASPANGNGNGKAAARAHVTADGYSALPARPAAGSQSGNSSRPAPAAPASGNGNAAVAGNGRVALPIRELDGDDRQRGTDNPMRTGSRGNPRAIAGNGSDTPTGLAAAGNGTARTAAEDGAELVQRRITTAAVVIVALVAAAASYDHQRALAELAGEGWRSLLFPLSVDGLLTAATMLMLTRRRAGQRAGRLTWIALTLGVTASVAGNVIGADPTIVDPVLVARLVAAWPPVALFLSLELLMRQLGIRSDGNQP